MTLYNSNNKNQVTAVFFDVGGVCVHSPLEAIIDIEKKLKLPVNYLNVAIQEVNGQNGSWQLLERGELSIDEFIPRFEDELNGNKEKVNQLYLKYAQSRSLPVPSKKELEYIKSVHIPSNELFHAMMTRAHSVQKETIFFIKQLHDLRLNEPIIRKLNLQINALTNNFKPRLNQGLSNENDTLQPPFDIRYIFDNYIESSVIGFRKPEPEIFNAAKLISGINRKHESCLLIDDLGVNLKSANSLGWKTIRVPINGTLKAMKDAAKIIGIENLINWNELNDFNPQDYINQEHKKSKI